MPEVTEFKEEIYTSMKHMGLSDVAAKMLAELYISPEALSLDELSTRTKYSLASISTTLKLIDNFPFVKRLKKPGSTKVFVTVSRDRMEILKLKLKMIEEIEIQPTKKQLPQLIKAFKKKAKTAEEKAQLEIMKNHLEQIEFMEEIHQVISKKINEYEHK